MSNIIIYENLNDEELFLLSLKEGTKVLKYNDDDNDKLLNLIDKNTKYIGFVYHYKGYNNIPFFNKLYDISDNSEMIFISENFINLINKINSINDNIILDLITCDINNSIFIEEIQKLPITIRFSTNKKGNLSDWIQESHNINIRHLYFNDNIDNWNYLLTNAIIDDDILNITDNIGNVFEKIENTYYLLRNITWSVTNLNITNNTNFIQL
jgi:hypothetical protein